MEQLFLVRWNINFPLNVCWVAMKNKLAESMAFIFQSEFVTISEPYDVKKVEAGNLHNPA